MDKFVEREKYCLELTMKKHVALVFCRLVSIYKQQIGYLQEHQRLIILQINTASKTMGIAKKRGGK